MPNFTPTTSPDEVYEYLRETISSLQLFFSQGCKAAADHFKAREWSRFDVNLFAYLVRKEVFESLQKQGADVAIEEEDALTVEGMALCGLRLKKELIQLRVRKSKSGEIPKADTNGLEDFYQRNLFSNTVEDDRVWPLSLMLLWDVNEEMEFFRFWLGCPKPYGENWHWSKLISQHETGPESNVDHKMEFLEAFAAENPDVPLTRTKAEDKKRKTGTENDTEK
jgi:hypothetical protein